MTCGNTPVNIWFLQGMTDTFQIFAQNLFNTIIYPSFPADQWKCVPFHGQMQAMFSGSAPDRTYWSGVTSCIAEVIMVPIPLSIKVCLLGLVEEVVPIRAHRTLLKILLFHWNCYSIVKLEEGRSSQFALLKRVSEL